MPVSQIRPIQTLAAMLVVAAVAGPPGAAAQSEEQTHSGPLYEELARMDSVLFEAAFVTCDAEKFRSLFMEDAEFYHDIAGATVGEEVRTLNECPRERGVQRVVVPGSLEVYPMRGYGAIQMGVHRFVEAGAPTSTIARFVHLWRQQDGEWRIARVLSFDHRPERRAVLAPGSSDHGEPGSESRTTKTGSVMRHTMATNRRMAITDIPRSAAAERSSPALWRAR